MFLLTFEEICQHLLKKEPNQRPASVAEVLAALDGDTVSAVRQFTDAIEVRIG